MSEGLAEDMEASVADSLATERKIPIEVRLLKRYEEGTLPRAVKSVEFRVVSKELGLSVIGSDIEVLRQVVWSKLEKEFKIRWEPWYIVQIAPASSYRGEIETGFSLSQSTVFRGVAKDGSVLLREYDRSRNLGHWKYRSWPEEYHDERGNLLACIPATEANEQALDDFRDRINELKKRLARLVNPQHIENTLRDLSGVGLPSPEAKD